MGIPEINAIQDHPELVDCDLLRRFFSLRPRVAVALQFFLPESEACSIPVQRLQDLACLVAEQKQASRKWILGHLPLSHRCQTVDLFPQVCSLRSHENPYRRPVEKHPTVPSRPGIPFEAVQDSPLAVYGSERVHR